MLKDLIPAEKSFVRKVIGTCPSRRQPPEVVGIDELQYAVIICKVTDHFFGGAEATQYQTQCRGLCEPIFFGNDTIFVHRKTGPFFSIIVFEGIGA